MTLKGLFWTSYFGLLFTALVHVATGQPPAPVVGVFLTLLVLLCFWGARK